MKLELALAAILTVCSSAAFADGPYIVGEVTHSSLSLDKASISSSTDGSGEPIPIAG